MSSKLSFELSSGVVVMTSSAIAEACMKLAVVGAESAAGCVEAGVCDSCCIPKEGLPKTKRGVETSLAKEKLKITELESELVSTETVHEKTVAQKIADLKERQLKKKDIKRQKILASINERKARMSALHEQHKAILLSKKRKEEEKKTAQAKKKKRAKP